MGSQASSECASPDDAVQIREALADVLQSPPFRNTRQCQSLLKYVVEHTVAGQNQLLRERVIGTEVFGRSPDYDPGDDPIVRVRASEVRKRLAQYYQDRGGSPVRIEIPSGSYRAVFQWKTIPHAVAPVAPEPAPKRVLWLWTVVALVGVAAGFGVLRGVSKGAPSAIDQFWAPALASPKPILVYNATSTVFHSAHPEPGTRDLIAVRGQYTCIGDAYTSAMLSSMFTRKGKLYQLRYGSDLTFGDLRYQPSILIGAFNNQWTLQTMSDLRFVFDAFPNIRDRADNRVYAPRDLQPDGRTVEDYAIISRVLDSKTGELLIAAAGITQYGTRAAGEFLTSAPLMAALAKSAPADWPKKNVQVLIKANVVDDTPGAPAIVKTYFW
ncbi:MAG: hypothetical protein JO022_20285 [Acidobacteriaceae bacterium]|nr:hypothetical protein [Acidobacteriaceae bacterium]